MSDFSRRLVQWQRSHGRHGLPWQGTSEPYRVWLSEIMLQQTQVSTVLAYYLRFLARFPDVLALAQASEDEVLGLWTGLGYYSRARNLHRCAQWVCERHGGHFPSSADALMELPGIGPSTAAAIAAFCFDERISIMDGNVQRVLARFTGMPHELSTRTAREALATTAAGLLPGRARDMPAYTQGLMDLGATCCTPRQPRCADCPVTAQCVARVEGLADRLPVKLRRVRRSSERWWMLLAVRADGAVLLQQRPALGIWARLWVPPLFASETALLEACGPDAAVEPMAAFLHALTHKDLHLHPLRAGAAGAGLPGQWFGRPQWEALGMPAPVRRLLLEL